jgi:hypothetical protein
MAGLLTLCAGSSVFAVLSLVFTVLLVRGIRRLQGLAPGRALPAKGILLVVSPTPDRTTGVGASKRQMRTVTVDIEVAGRPPYEITTQLAIPMNLVGDVLPGATVELRVDPNDRTNIVLVGPGVGLAAASVVSPAVAPRSA